MSTKNIFDLKSLVVGTGSKPEPYVKTNFSALSDSERARVLENYEEVPSEKYGELLKGLHIRYQKADGSFKKGGFIVNNYVSSKDATKGNRMMRLSSSPKPGGTEWTINTSSNIDTIWKTIKYVPSPSITSTVTGMKQATEGLSEQLEQMRVDISRLANEQKRIIALIKKLHNIHV